MTSDLYTSRKWRKLREVVMLRDRGICQLCGGPASTVDHIVPVLEAPHLALSESNCRAACVKCNMGRPQARMARMARINRAAVAVRDW